VARSIRFQFPGAIYHIFSRGNRKEHIFLDEEDRAHFLKLLTLATTRMNWICHAYCLMGNHYHLLIETPDGILDRGMQHMNSVYAQRFNRKHGQVGHLFQGRYTAKLVDGNQQFLLAARYISRNPLEAHLVEDAEHWKWCSYKATIGNTETPDFLIVDQVLSCLSQDKNSAQRFFKFLVHTDIGKDGEKIVELIKAENNGPRLEALLRTILDAKQSVAPVQRQQRILSRPTLGELFSGVNVFKLNERNRMIVEAFRFYGYTQLEIGSFLGLNRSTISKIICKTY
jgi:putative transposase